MTVLMRMKALLRENYVSSAESGDTKLVRLSCSTVGYGTSDLLFTDAADAKAAENLLKPLGFNVTSANDASVFTSLAAFKASAWYKQELARVELNQRLSKLEKRAESLLKKVFRLDKPFLGLPSGSLFALGRGTSDWYVTGYEGNTSQRVWRVEIEHHRPSHDRLDELEKVLDQLETGKVVPESAKWGR